MNASQNHHVCEAQSRLRSNSRKVSAMRRHRRVEAAVDDAGTGTGTDHQRSAAHISEHVAGLKEQVDSMDEATSLEPRLIDAHRQTRLLTEANSVRTQHNDTNGLSVQTSLYYWSGMRKIILLESRPACLRSRQRNSEPGFFGASKAQIEWLG